MRRILLPTVMLVVFAFAMAARAGTAVAQEPAPAVQGKRMTPQQRDEWRFLKYSAAASRFEAAAARLALDRSNDAVVRAHARALLERKASAGNELLHLLQSRAIAPPMYSDTQRKTLNRLGRLQGAKFDREFLLAAAREGQQQEAEMLQRAGLAARDPQIRAWIDRSQPARLIVVSSR